MRLQKRLCRLLSGGAAASFSFQTAPKVAFLTFKSWKNSNLIEGTQTLCGFSGIVALFPQPTHLCHDFLPMNRSDKLALTPVFHDWCYSYRPSACSLDLFADGVTPSTLMLMCVTSWLCVSLRLGFSSWLVYSRKQIKVKGKNGRKLMDPDWFLLCKPSSTSIQIKTYKNMKINYL